MPDEAVTRWEMLRITIAVVCAAIVGVIISTISGFLWAMAAGIVVTGVVLGAAALVRRLARGRTS